MHIRLLAVAGLSLIGLLTVSVAAEPHPAGACCPHCRQPCFQDVVVQRCRMEPVRKPIKQTVYSTKLVPYCLHEIPKGKTCCLRCEACPRYKRVLVKREVVVGEKCETECVVEDVVERVAVPCGCAR